MMLRGGVDVGLEGTPARHTHSNQTTQTPHYPAAKDDLVDAAGDERGAGVAVASDEAHQAGGRAAGGERGVDDAAVVGDAPLSLVFVFFCVCLFVCVGGSLVFVFVCVWGGWGRKGLSLVFFVGEWGRKGSWGLKGGGVRVHHARARAAAPSLLSHTRARAHTEAHTTPATLHQKRTSWRAPRP